MSVVGVEKVRRKYMAEVSQESDPNASKRPGPGVLEGTRTQARINGIEEKKPLTREEFLKGEFLRQFDKTGTFDRKKATAEANVDLQEQKERMEEERARILEWKYKGGQQKETPMRAEDTVPILERINKEREEGKFNQVDNQQQEKEPIAQTTATEDSSATTEIATPVDADKSEKAEQPADTSKEAKPKTSEVKIGSATWKNKNGDQPVKITGEAGVGADGRRYVHIEGSQAGIPLDEIEYPEKTEGVASAENAEKSSVVEKKTEGEKEITAEVAAEITVEDKAKKKTEETETLNTEKLGKTKEENKIDLESNPDLVKRLEDATLKNGWLTNEQRFIVVRNWYLGKLGYRMKINMVGGEDKYIYKNTGEDKYRKEDRVRDENGKPVKFSLTFWPPKLTAKGEIKPNRRQSHLKFLEREFNKRELNKNEAAAGVVAPTSESAVPEAAAPAEQTPGDIEQQELQTTTDSIFEATLPDADAQDKIFGEATKKTKEHVDKMTEEERTTFLGEKNEEDDDLNYARLYVENLQQEFDKYNANLPKENPADKSAEPTPVTVPTQKLGEQEKPLTAEEVTARIDEANKAREARTSPLNPLGYSEESVVAPTGSEVTAASTEALNAVASTAETAPTTPVKKTPWHKRVFGFLKPKKTQTVAPATPVETAPVTEPTEEVPAPELVETPVVKEVTAEALTASVQDQKKQYEAYLASLKYVDEKGETDFDLHKLLNEKGEYVINPKTGKPFEYKFFDEANAFLESETKKEQGKTNPAS